MQKKVNLLNSSLQMMQPYLPKPEKVLRQLFRSTYMEVAGDFGLTVSVAKTKLTVSGREVTAEDKAPIAAGDEQVESVNEFS